MYSLSFVISAWNTPHVVDGKTVYVRTGQSKRPEDLIDPTRLQWLHNLRQKFESFRIGLITSARNRRDNLLDQEQILSKFLDGNSPSVPFWEFVSVPVFPQLPLFELRNIQQVMNTLRACSAPRGETVIDLQTRQIGDGVQWGRAKLEPEKTLARRVDAVALPGDFEYGELNRYGLLYRAKSIDAPRDIYVRHLGWSIAALIRSSISLYESHGYFGPIEVSCKFHNMLSCKARRYGNWGESPKSLIDNEFGTSRQVPVYELSESRKQFTAQLPPFAK